MSKFKVGDKVYRPSDPILKRRYEVIETGLVLVKHGGATWQLNERDLELAPETVTLTIELDRQVSTELESLGNSEYWFGCTRSTKTLIEAIRKAAK